jgi:tetratricopeptide (TPR) repeat protein
MELILPDRFEIDREIGRGGMAVVYRAHDKHLGRFVAIKVLSPDLSHAVGIERFQREIALMARLVHPGIVTLFDSGEVDGRLFYVMPLVTGETLRARLDRERLISSQDSAALAADVAEALAYAHGMGVVHRDVKPENIFTVGGRALLGDFGIARLVDQGSPGSGAHALTTHGVVLGTLAYMSPEQASGETRIDGRADLYSLGCVLFELLSGRPPFESSSFMGMLSKHITETPVAPSAAGATTTPEMDGIVLQLLAKEPAERPANAAEVARTLRAASVVRSVARAAAPKASDADHLVELGLRAFNQFGPTGGSASRAHLDEAKAYLTRALALDPNHARGLCAMGNWYYVAGVNGLLPSAEAYARGRELIFSALAADDRCAEVHCSMGKLALYHDDDFHSAARHIRRAAELDPNEPEALRLLSIVYKILGRSEDAVQAARSAAERMPDNASLWNALGDALLFAGRNVEAEQALEHAIAILPGYGPALERLEMARARLGDVDQAFELRVSRMRLANQRARADLLEADALQFGMAEAMRGDIRRELDGLLSKAEHSDPFNDYVRRNDADRIVSAFTVLGEWSKAMDWVERAYEWRPGRLRRMLADLPVNYHGLAVDPRYARLMRVAGMGDMM